MRLNKIEKDPTPGIKKLDCRDCPEEREERTGDREEAKGGDREGRGGGGRKRQDPR